MVFQKPNPFPKSIYDNVAFGPKVAGFKGNMDDLVEESLAEAALWDEVKEEAEGLRDGPVRRTAAAAVHRARDRDPPRRDPDGRAVLGPRPGRDVQDRGPDAGPRLGVHDRDRDAQHAAGSARLDRTAFFTVDVADDGHRTGHIVEFDRTESIFTNPSDPRTEDYVTGRFG